MGFVVPINSSIFNTLEFVFFDVVIAAFVYVLTSKLVGLYNCYDVKTNPREAQLCDDIRAPLFDQGIICTKRHIFYAAVFVRMVSWALIIGASLLVRGRRYPVITKDTAMVRALGSFSTFDSEEQLIENMIRRQGCVKRTPHFSYFGELRNDSCELNPELLSKPIIEMGLSFDTKSVTTRGCSNSTGLHGTWNCNATEITRNLWTLESNFQIACIKNETGDVSSELYCNIRGNAPQVPCSITDDPSREVFKCGNEPDVAELRCSFVGTQIIPYTICDDAVMSCRTESVSSTCSGFLSINGLTHICRDLKLGNMSNHQASCKWVRGADWNITDFVHFYGLPAAESINNAFATAYGSGVESRIVKVYAEGQSYLGTDVPYTWLVIMIMKILLVVILFVCCELMRRRHKLRAIAHDESGIFKLVRATIHNLTRSQESMESTNDGLRVELVNGVPCVYEEINS